MPATGFYVRIVFYGIWLVLVCFRTPGSRNNVRSLCRLASHCNQVYRRRKARLCWRNWQRWALAKARHSIGKIMTPLRGKRLTRHGWQPTRCSMPKAPAATLVLATAGNAPSAGCPMGTHYWEETLYMKRGFYADHDQTECFYIMQKSKEGHGFCKEDKTYKLRLTLFRCCTKKVLCR